MCVCVCVCFFFFFFFDILVAKMYEKLNVKIKTFIIKRKLKERNVHINDSKNSMTSQNKIAVCPKVSSVYVSMLDPNSDVSIVNR